MKERVLRAYFSEGELISDHATLERLALEVGLPRDEVRDVLSSDRYAAEIRDDERTATQLGDQRGAVSSSSTVRSARQAPIRPSDCSGCCARRARPTRRAVAAGETCAADRSGC